MRRKSNIIITILSKICIRNFMDQSFMKKYFKQKINNRHKILKIAFVSKLNKNLEVKQNSKSKN
jgi:hypothetical protein